MKLIRSRSLLATAFTTLIIIIISISLWNVKTLTNSNTLFNEVYTKPLKVREATFKANYDILAIQSAIKDGLLSRTVSQIDETVYEVNNKGDAFYNEFITLVEVNQNYNKIIKDTYSDYSEFLIKRQQLYSYMYNGEFEKAYDYYNTEMLPTLDIVKEKMDMLINETIKDLDSFYKVSQVQTRNNLLILFLLTVLAILLSLFISIIITRKILKYERALYLEKEQAEIILQSIGDGVIATDKNKNILLVNGVAEKLTGLTQSEAVGKSFSDVFKLSHENSIYEIINPVDIVLETNNKYERSNHAILTASDGSICSIAETASPIKDGEGNTTGVVIIFSDETEKRRYTNKIKYVSYHDGLTGLYNRTYYESEIEKLNESCQTPVSIIMGDVNGLKLINDVYGHSEGDDLLLKIAAILTECSKGKGIVSRWGGDEFSILLPDVSYDEALQICNDIKDKCVERSTDTILVSISLGVSTKVNSFTDLDLIMKEADDQMYTQKMSEGKAVRKFIVDLLQQTLSHRSCETEDHIAGMLRLTEKVSEKMGLSKKEIDDMRLFVLLHDIGKIAVPDSILNKPDKLNEQEFEELKKHPETGYRIAHSTDEFVSIAGLVLTHHEKWDGSGYPQGLVGEDIPKLSRLLSIIDAYDVMTNDRPYKKAISHEEALNEIRRCAGTQFEPDMANKFIDIVNEE